MHRQVVYEPNVQEETLTAEAADSPDFTLYSESCTNHVLLRFSYSTQNGACVHQLLTPAVAAVLGGEGWGLWRWFKWVSHLESSK